MFIQSSRTFTVSARQYSEHDGSPLFDTGHVDSFVFRLDFSQIGPFQRVFQISHVGQAGISQVLVVFIGHITLLSRLGRQMAFEILVSILHH